jgi:hypothetical protein
MIKILGAKRILTIVALLGINALLGAIVYLYLMPEQGKKQRELTGLRGNISTVQTDISRMQIEFDQLEEQQDQFDDLKARGFFGNQGRREAEIVFQKIQSEAGVISAAAKISPGTVEENEEAQKAEHKILVSPVKIDIEAMDDVDVFRYIYLVEKFFPGHVTIQKVTLERQAEITGPVLRSIATNTSPKLVVAVIEAQWRTMIPQTEVIGFTPEAP